MPTAAPTPTPTEVNATRAPTPAPTAVPTGPGGPSLDAAWTCLAPKAGTPCTDPDDYEPANSKVHVTEVPPVFVVFVVYFVVFSVVLLL